MMVVSVLSELFDFRLLSGKYRINSRHVFRICADLYHCHRYGARFNWCSSVVVEQGCGSLSATAMRSGSVLGDLGVAQVGFSVGSPAAAEVVRRAWSNDLLYIFLLWCRGEFMGLQ